MYKINKIVVAGAVVGLLAVSSASVVLAQCGGGCGEGGSESGMGGQSGAMSSHGSPMSSHAGMMGGDAGADSINGDAYTLGTCPVTGEKLGSMGDPVSINHDGRSVKLCCGGCISKFKADAAKHIAKIDAAVVKQQMEFYPLDSCPVTGNKLGGMGTPVDFVSNNRLVRLCCGGCIKKIEANPAKYILTLDETVIKAQLASYPLTTDVVTGKKLGAYPINFVSGNRLVRLASEASIAKFNQNPNKFFAKLDAAS